MEFEKFAAEEEFMAFLLYFDGQGGWELLAVGAEDFEDCICFAMVFDTLIGPGEEALLFDCMAGSHGDCKSGCAYCHILYKLSSIHRIALSTAIFR